RRQGALGRGALRQPEEERAEERLDEVALDDGRAQPAPRAFRLDEDELEQTEAARRAAATAIDGELEGDRARLRHARERLERGLEEARRDADLDAAIARAQLELGGHPRRDHRGGAAGGRERRPPGLDDAAAA